MAEGDGGDDPIHYLPPRHGFSEGTKKGLRATAWLLGVLVLIVLADHFVTGARLDVVADLVFALIVAVAGVWVVGGMVTIKSEAFDLGLKAGGGMALLLVFTIFVKPFSATDGVVAHDVVFVVDPDGEISSIVDEAIADLPGLEISTADLAILRQFNPNRSRLPIEFAADEPKLWHFDKTPAMLKILRDVVKRSKSCLTLEEPDGKERFRLTVNRERVVAETVGGGRRIYRCK
ncbi:hypothetical protein L2U69_05840 [Zavarzinia compransoris]|uniref:hypothetical protein n=1 Tax=Zavarzinia marina TaxID=2911065 RepID=UPI001F1DCE57|nr:hypothetical protein [Zavarzinia marina]MCF4165157.1 hypothetical protein [Zavarzinia marina]